MNSALRIILAIATLLTTLGLAVGSVASFVTGKPPLLGIVCWALTVMFGVFVYNDYQYFFGKKTS